MGECLLSLYMIPPFCDNTASADPSQADRTHGLLPGTDSTLCWWQEFMYVGEDDAYPLAKS